jgi:hypothetical protein
MGSLLVIIIIALGLMFLYGVGVFAICLHAGENRLSAAVHASAWWVAFSVSHFFGYMAITFH